MGMEYYTYRLVAIPKGGNSGQWYLRDHVFDYSDEGDVSTIWHEKNCSLKKGVFLVKLAKYLR